MKAFLDTSSLFKLYHEERESEIVLGVLSNGVTEIFLAETAILEFRSAVWKKVREKQIDESVGMQIVSYFQADYENYQWIRLQPDIINMASNLLMKYGRNGLRTLDSLQLASALSLKDNNECVFLTSDDLLRSLFKKEDLRTV
ncbi:MAG: type II toxin-antitoxin system VapC family toxin [Candidatus Schekmanbacteria bacterium]|nr:type II toxin-antitoxin system VapC family toxin [Candidatus Schekmanbacteria bacterium]